MLDLPVTSATHGVRSSRKLLRPTLLTRRVGARPQDVVETSKQISGNGLFRIWNVCAREGQSARLNVPRCNFQRLTYSHLKVTT